MKRRLISAAIAAVFSVLAVASPAAAAEHHPPKFNVKSTQCTGTANHPNCPGSH